MKKNFWILICMVAASLLVSACAGQKASQAADAEPAQDAPEDATAAPLPEGPEVDDQGIRPQGAKTAESPAETVAAGVATVTRRQIERFRNRGPAYVLTLMQFEPVHGTAGFRGFKIVEAKSSARDFMTPLVQMGDVVTHINGIRIERPDDFLQAWKTLENAAVIRIDLLRDENPMNVSWDVEE